MFTFSKWSLPAEMIFECRHFIWCQRTCQCFLPLRRTVDYLYENDWRRSLENTSKRATVQTTNAMGEVRAVNYKVSDQLEEDRGNWPETICTNKSSRASDTALRSPTRIRWKCVRFLIEVQFSIYGGPVLSVNATNDPVICWLSLEQGPPTNDWHFKASLVYS